METTTTKIFNMTQHAASQEEVLAGVQPGDTAQELKTLLTFNTLPTAEQINARAEKLADMAAASGCHAAMIGGAPYLMPVLEKALRARGIEPLYAFSERRSVEKTMPDGTVQKASVFKFLGFVKTE